MPPDTAAALGAAYTFLRRVEHRIQYLDDQQTHILPTDDASLNWIALTLGHANCCRFLAELDTHRELVAQEFDKLLGDGRSCKSCNGGAKGASASPLQLANLLPLLPPALQARLDTWRAHPKVLALRDEARERLLRLVQRTAQWLHEGRISEEAAVRLVDWIEPLLRRESYLALLLERPAVHERLLRLLGAARWPARYLLRHPGVIDELASADWLHERVDAASFERELHERRAALARTGEDDEENLLNLLRRAHHAEVFRTLARDVEAVLTVEQVSDDLSALADVVLRVTTQWCWERLRNRHRDEPQFAIIGYGKLGGKELSYGSDLDIVFVYEDEHERAPEGYAALVRKLINWLTVKTSEGDLFEIDTALRPNGNSGLLITTFQAYADYQQQRGSNTAWTWEHQAMTRARFVLGSEALRQRFDAVRAAVISAPRDAASLKEEIRTMRERVRSAHAVPAGRFDVKHSPGGMVDAEFAVQYLVLSQSAAHPALADNVGNIALMQRAEVAGLLPQGVGLAAADAYRELRRLQHHARLNEVTPQVDPATCVAEQAAVMALWQAVLA
jgi:glutamate-ammonia-ligase adenylyltransferase